MLPRSHSASASGAHAYGRRIYQNVDADSGQVMNLITCDLWAAITGETVTPETIHYMQDAILTPPSPQPRHTCNYAMMALDRQECRNLQQKLQDGSEQERAAIFNGLFDQLGELIYDGSANYVIQKLCEVSTKQQQTKFLGFFLGNIYDVIEQPNGCRVLQKFIECTDAQNIDQIFVALKPKLIYLCRSMNGNHIVQRFIEFLPDRIGEIIEVLKPQVVELGVDNCGCRVVQRLFDKMTIEKLEPLVIEVLRCATTLATDQYGNYVVQSILKAGQRKHVSELIKAFTGHFYEFSIHKFASNVIEKCIRGATPKEREQIFDEIIVSNGEYANRRILKMIGDQFGNYVIQRIIEFGSETQQNAIYDVVYDQYERLITMNYAKHVITCLENQDFVFE